MSIKIEELINRYENNCNVIINGKCEYIDIYKKGIISMVQEDFENGLITSENSNAYFAKLEHKILNLEEKLNSDINSKIKKETDELSYAISSLLSLKYQDDERIKICDSLLPMIKDIYKNSDRVYKKDIHKEENIDSINTQSLEDLFNEVNSLLNI